MQREDNSNEGKKNDCEASTNKKEAEWNKKKSVMWRTGLSP